MALFKIKSSSRSRRNKNKDKEQKEKEKKEDKSSVSSQQQQKKKNNNDVVESPSSSSSSSSKTTTTNTTTDSTTSSFLSSSSSSSSSSLTNNNMTLPSSSRVVVKEEETVEKIADDDDDDIIEDVHPDDEIDEEALNVFKAKQVKKQSYREIAAELEQDDDKSDDEDSNNDEDLDIDKHMDEISDMIFEVEKEEILNGRNGHRSSSSSSTATTGGDSKDESPKQPPPPVYTLEDHCRNLNLKRTSDNNQEMWYIDRTPEYVYGGGKKDSDGNSTRDGGRSSSGQGGRRSSSSFAASSNVVILRNIIQDYIQPISTTDTKFQYDRIGLTSVLSSISGEIDDDDHHHHLNNTKKKNSSSSKTSSSKEDDESEDEEEPLPVRTVTIRIRPDGSQELILKSVKKVFEEYNNNNNSNKQNIMVLDDTFDCYKAIGCNGCGVLMCILANIVTHKITLERKLWLRFYHIYQLTDRLLSKNQLQQLVDLKQSNHGPQIIPKRTAKQIDFVEASSVVQFMKQHNLTGTDPSPTENSNDTSIWFQATFEPSPSAMSIFYNNDKVYPALAKQDFALWHSTFDIVDRIWYQLSKVHFLTYDTLLDPTRRFGSIRWQQSKSKYNIIDSNYGYQLSKISRQHTQSELHSHLIKATSIYQNSIDEYNELIDFLITVHTRQYNIPLSQELCEMLEESSTTHNNKKRQSKLSQTKFVLSKRHRDDYPWHKYCQLTLQQIQDEIKMKGTVTQQQHLSKVNKYVRQFLLSLSNVDDQEQQLVLKEINRRGMVEVSQIQNVAKQLLATLIMFPMKYKHLPHIMNPSNDWYEFSIHSKTSNTRRNPLPLHVFKTKLGQGCITPTQLMFVTGYLSTKVEIYDWMDIELQYTPNNMLTKISVINSHTNQKICGFYPSRDDDTTTSLDCEKLIRICRTIKALQEA